MKIEVIIPVVQYDLAMDLLHQINENTRPPDRVIIINNTQQSPSWYPFENFIMEFYHTETSMVNESWELGRSLISPDCDYVTFLNDDLIIGSWFFQRVIETFEANEKYGIVCPNTVDHPNKVFPGKVEYVVGRSNKLEGWAFTIRKDLLDQVPPLPWERISTFCGDSLIWDHVKRMGYSWGKDTGNNIYHYVGQSILKFGYRRLKKPDRTEYEKIKQEIWGK
jgi:hypothetical protein